MTPPWRHLELPPFLERLRVLTVKELLQLGRDVGLIAFIAYAFTGDVYVAGSGMQMQLRNATIAVYDGDGSAASRELISRFHLPEFRIQTLLSDAREGLRLLDEGRTMVLLDIPPQFERDLASRRQTAVQLQVDASNSVIGTWAAAYATQIAATFATDRAMGSTPTGAAMPITESRHRIWFNPNSMDEWFVPVIEMMNMVTMLSIMLPAAVMVREKERGTIEQLLVSPLTPMQIMLPKVLAMALVILLGITGSIAMLRFAFHVPIRGSLLLFYVVSVIYVITTSGLGLAIATLVNNLAQVGMAVILALSPIMLLSGTWVPAEGMPPGVRWIMYISPLHYYVEITLGIFLRGTGLDVLWDHLLVMTLLGLVMFAIGLLRFRAQLR